MNGACRRCRSLREDRTLLCVNNFIRLTDTIEHAGTRLPAMGPRFAEPLTDTARNAAFLLIGSFLKRRTRISKTRPELHRSLAAFA